MEMNVRRGDIYIADLRGQDEMYGIRPVCIVQNDAGNKFSNKYIAALITSKKKKELPTHVKVQSECGLRKCSTILCESLVTVTKEELIDYVGTIVNTQDEKAVDKALAISLQI